MNMKSTLLIGTLLLCAQTISCSAPKPGTPKQEKPQEQEIANTSPSFIKRCGFASLGFASLACAGAGLIVPTLTCSGLKDIAIRNRNDLTGLYRKEKQESGMLLASTITGLAGCFLVAKFGLNCLKKAFSSKAKGTPVKSAPAH